MKKSTRFRQFKVSLVTTSALALLFTAPPPMAAPGGTVSNGTPTGIVVPNGFLFEPEVPFTSLKNVPTWSELEQLLDNPYLATPDPATPGNDQGFPSYRATGLVRRPSFGVTLPALLVHPLNYNTTTGEEMRLINPKYPGGTFNVTDQLVLQPGADPAVGPYQWTRSAETISPGAGRVLETAIDYNNPIPADPGYPGPCVISLEFNPPEGSTLCGGDPGEPNYGGFGFRVGPASNPVGYSTPAVPLNSLAVAQRIPGRNITGLKLVDPAGCADRNAESPGSCLGQGVIRRLRKPTIRTQLFGDVADYVQNTDPNNVKASNENDYIRGNNPAQRQANKQFAIALGKALFWDMQVGSDGVQSCGTCHFNGTGTDTRTKNQINPNHIGGDSSFQLMQPNERDLAATDFPLHKLTDPEVAGDPACATPITASVNTGVLENNFPGGVTGFKVCDKANATNLTTINGVSDQPQNDVVSSMGVHFGLFKDIAPIGTFVGSGVLAVAPDLRSSVAADNVDPIPGFAGTTGNQFRRVEPRNTPTMQAAGFNFDNFWDGRARHDFNGGSVFGAADPQAHVFVDPGLANGNDLTATRQIIRFTSIASLATGPGLSEFEMSFQGRNWAKIGKKLLQVGVTPLANQLVATTDSVLGPYSNQGGSLCAGLPVAARSPGSPAVGKPGLCINYRGLIRRAFNPHLWQNTGQHLNGCYTDGNATLHANQCAAGTVAIPVLVGGAVVDSPADPFDGYVLTSAAGPALVTDTNQFKQMEANFSLFWGLAVQSWVNILVPDDTPFDRVQDANPGAFAALGEPGEPGLVADLLMCGQSTPVPGDVNDPNYCFTEVGNFKRDPGVSALRKPAGEGGVGGILVPSGGTRNSATDPDPLLGMDIFFASNLSLKNPNFRTGRCGECHAIPTLTDHTMPFTSKINLMDAVNEFSAPGVELVVEPLARLRVITGFLLESELMENGQDAVERRIVNQSIVPNPVDGLAYPGATADGLPAFDPAVFGGWTGADSAFLDNGIYNLGVTRCVANQTAVTGVCDDNGRGNTDAFGWPLSLTTLMMKNLAGPAFEPGVPMDTFDPDLGITGGLFEETAQDQQINPGFDGEPATPRLPPYLAAFANNITVGDFPPELDEAGGAIGGMVNTLSDVAMIEGFMDTLGPFNPGNIAAEVLNFGGFSNRPGDVSAQMGTWPEVNRVGRFGSFKAPQLRNVELTGPYFHNGGKLTLRQVVDFYTRGGDFPISNAAHRDFNLVNMNIEVQSNLTEAEKVALVDFLLELTDERNLFDRAPFDHPQVIVPLDGLAPDNTLGRSAMLTGCVDTVPANKFGPGRQACDGGMFLNVPEVGATGMGAPEPTFLSVRTDDRNAPHCDPTAGSISHYCH